MNIANLAQCPLLAIYHLISNMWLWNNTNCELINCRDSSSDFNTHSGIFPGKHATGEKEGLNKRGMSKPGRAVVLSGTSTEPPYSDVPVDLSSDDKNLVMEYSGKANLMCTAS